MTPCNTRAAQHLRRRWCCAKAREKAYQRPRVTRQEVRQNIPGVVAGDATHYCSEHQQRRAGSREKKIRFIELQ
jgi:hypothetical protein